MNFYPAIDIKDGKFIRLRQGCLDEVTVYGDNPVEIAKKFSEAGAKWIHVVDIDGAFKGKSINQKVILDIKKNSNTKIQVGGGIRTQKSAGFYLNNGVDRVVLGTIALEKPKIIKQLCESYPGRIAVGIDAKKGMVATEGWSKTSTIEVGKLSKLYEKVIFQQMYEYFDNIFSNYLCGFRQGQNTQHSSLCMLKRIRSFLDKGKCTGILLTDLSKAFDSISH